MIAKFSKHVDLNYTLGLMEKLISFKSNPDLGYRTSGSAAEIAAGDFLHEEMKRIGLKNVHKDAVVVDTFEFKRADISYKMANGNIRKFLLSSFQARCLAENEKIKIVYVNKGRDIDYENIDVEGKYVLIDINMVDDWWVNWPITQAKVKKAKGGIIVQVGGYCSWSKDTLGVQDISTTCDLPAFSMTVREAELFKEQLKLQGGEIEAILNADVNIVNNGITNCIIGEIPGKIDEVIYLIGHYDAYFTAFADNASGIGCIMGICKALIEDGYTPDRTLRICLHGAEEWGVEGTRYDWARGATMLVHKHPEWSDTGFLLVNLDGNLINGTASAVRVRTSYEMVEGIEKLGQNIEGNVYPFGTYSPMWTWTESYMYACLGIPTIESFYEGVNFWPSYHSSSDQKDVNDYSDEVFLSSHILYGTILQKFDKLPVRPLDFSALFDKMLDEIDGKIVADSQSLCEKILKAKEVALILKKKNNSFTKIDSVTKKYNKKVGRIFSKIVNELFGIDWFEQYNFIHMRNQNNIHYLTAAIENLKSGNIEKAMDEDLRGVDLCWYGYHFDKHVYDILVDQVIGETAPFTWAKGKVTTIADMWDIGRELQKLRNEGVTNYTQVISKLEKEIEVQKNELKEKFATEIDILEKLICMMEDCIKD